MAINHTANGILLVFVPWFRERYVNALDAQLSLWSAGAFSSEQLLLQVTSERSLRL